MIWITTTIAAAAGQIMATALGAPGPGRFAAVDAVVRKSPTVTLGHGDNVDKVDVLRSARLSASVPDRIGRLAGVRSAVGDLAFPVTVVAHGGALVRASGGSPAHAHGWPSAALTPYRLIAGHSPAGSHEIVLDRGLSRLGGFRIGDSVRVVSPAGVETFKLAGVVTASRAEQQRQSSVFLTQIQAERLSGLGWGFDAIGIRFNSNTSAAAMRERIARALGGSVQVLDRRHAAAADAGDPRAYDRVQLVAVIASSGGITLAISVFVLAGTVAFAAERRRRPIALVRAIGATPGQVRSLLLRETTIIGLTAGAVGCLAAHALFDVFASALVSVGLAPDGFTIAPSWIPYGIAVAVGVVVAVLATLLAGRRALAVRPGEALVESSMPPRRIGLLRSLLGLVAVGGGLTIVIVLSAHALSFATLAAFLFIIGVGFLAPAVLGLPIAFAGRALSRVGGAGFLATSGLTAGRFRTGAVGAAVALVVALAGTQVLSIATARRATERVTSARVRAQYVLVPRSGGGLPPALAHTAAHLPSAAASGFVSTNVFLLDHGLTNQGSSWNAAGLDPSTTPTLLDLGVESGSLAEVRGDGIAISDTLARAGGVAIGRVVHARLADATPATLRVVAIYRRANGLGDVVMAQQLALQHATAALDSAVFVNGRGERFEHALRALVDAVPATVLRSRTEYLAGVDAQGKQNARAQWAVSALMILLAIIAAFNAGAIAAVQRRGEFVLARLSGATRGQVIGALTLESVLTAGGGIVMGAIVAIASLARAGSDPDGGPLAVPWGQAAVVLAGGIALGLLGTLLPVALAGRAPLVAVAGAQE